LVDNDLHSGQAKMLTMHSHGVGWLSLTNTSKEASQDIYISPAAHSIPAVTNTCNSIKSLLNWTSTFINLIG